VDVEKRSFAGYYAFLLKRHSVPKFKIKGEDCMPHWSKWVSLHGENTNMGYDVSFLRGGFEDAVLYHGIKAVTIDYMLDDKKLDFIMLLLANQMAHHELLEGLRSLGFTAEYKPAKKAADGERTAESFGVKPSPVILITSYNQTKMQNFSDLLKKYSDLDEWSLKNIVDIIFKPSLQENKQPTLFGSSNADRAKFTSDNTDCQKKFPH